MWLKTLRLSQSWRVHLRFPGHLISTKGRAIYLGSRKTYSPIISTPRPNFFDLIISPQNRQTSITRRYSDFSPHTHTHTHSISLSLSHSLSLSLYTHSHFPPTAIFFARLAFSNSSTLSYPLTHAYNALNPPPTTHIIAPLSANNPTRCTFVNKPKIGYG
jgi:hypothetical protein